MDRLPESRTRSVISASNGRVRLQAATPAAGRAKSTWMTAPASGSPSSACSVPRVASIQRGGRRLVVEVAFDPLGDPRRPQRGEAFVEQPTGFAELRVGAVAQRQHGVAHALEARRIVGHQRRMEIDGALRRIALAPGAGDHQQVLRAGDLRGRGIRHVQHARGEAQLAGRLARRLGQRLGIAGLGGEQDGERRPACRRRSRCGLRRGRRLIAGEEAAQPGPLLGAGARDDAVQRDDLFRREGRGLRQHGVLLRDRGAASCQAASSGRSATTGPMTISVGAFGGMAAAARSASASVVTATRWRGVVASVMKATGSVCGTPGRAQVCGDRADLSQRHVEHQHIGAARQGRPVEVGQLAAGVVAGHEGDAVRQAAMRHRDSGGGCAADAGADAGDDAEADAGGGERQRLLAAAAEYQRVAALQPHHAMAVARQADQALVDAKLRRAPPAGALADRLQPRLRCERQDLRRDQRVVQHDVGFGQGVRGVQGQQARIAGTGADQPDGAWLEDRRNHASHPLACSSASVSAATSLPSRRHAARTLAQQVEPLGPLGPVIRRQPCPDARREARAGAARGHRQQQVAAPDLGHAVEVAQRGPVLDIDQHPLRHGPGRRVRRQGRRAGR